jgi:hypothetical protein
MKVSQLHRPRTHAGPGCRPKVAKLLDVELAEQGLLSLIIHPGHVSTLKSAVSQHVVSGAFMALRYGSQVQTDMGGDTAPLTAQESSPGRRCHFGKK